MWFRVWWRYSTNLFCRLEIDSHTWYCASSWPLSVGLSANCLMNFSLDACTCKLGHPFSLSTFSSFVWAENTFSCVMLIRRHCNGILSSPEGILLLIDVKYASYCLSSLLEGNARVVYLGTFVCLFVCLCTKLNDYCSDWLDWFTQEEVFPWLDPPPRSGARLDSTIYVRILDHYKIGPNMTYQSTPWHQKCITMQNNCNDVTCASRAHMPAAICLSTGSWQTIYIFNFNV